MPETILKNLSSNIADLRSNYKCEYLIIGSGPGGSVAAEILSKNNKDVIILEEGIYHEEMPTNENVGSTTSKLYRNGGVFPFVGLPTIAFAEGCCVGGGSFINGGLLWRTPGSILQKWESEYGLKGYGENDLEKHFDEIETKLNVTRHTLDKDSNYDSIFLAEGAENLGWKYVMVPRAVKNCSNKNLCAIGCPTGAKQGMVQTYLPDALNNGARLISSLKAKSIECKGSKAFRVVAQSKDTSINKTVVFDFDKLIVAGGAVQTPHILRRSGLSKKAGKKLEFHMNLKIIARFDKEIDAENGTIFTVQVQEFENEGTLFMASTMRRTYLAMTFSHFGTKAVDRALEDYRLHGLYVAMIKPQSKAHIVSCLGEHPFVWYKFDPADIVLIKRALKQAAKLLFASGAVELYLPIVGSTAIRDMAQLDLVLEKTPARHYEIITVHAMSSCAIGANKNTSVIDLEGRLHGFDNVFVTDASVLPTNIGESPQGTIMAFASEIMLKHIN